MMMFFSDSAPCVGCEYLKISCKVSHVSGGFMAVVKSNCYSEQFVCWVFFSTCKYIQDFTSLYVFLYWSRENQVALMIF